MKTLALALVLGLSATAQARTDIIDLDVEVEVARMKVTQATGTLADHKNFRLVRAYNGDGIEFYKLQIPVGRSLPAFKVKTLEVVSREIGGCGSTIIQMIDVEEKNNADNNHSYTLVDHKTRMCEDYRPYRWEMHVDYSGFPGIMGTMDAVGNPVEIVR